VTASAERLRERPGIGDTARLVLRAVIVPLALAGMGVSAYLSFVHFAGAPLYCTSSGGCHTVQSSEYAKVGGVPVALLGFVLYSTILVAGLVNLFGPRSLSEVAPFVVFGLSLSGILYSSYLTWLELYRIHAICVWCVASAGLMAALFLASAGDLWLSRGWSDVEED
jgi:uncharacterized membrane protein